MHKNNNDLMPDIGDDSYDIEMECANQVDTYGKELIKQVTYVQPALKTKALRWHMPIIGEVPMSK